MGEKISIYVRDDKLYRWLERQVEAGTYRSLSHAFEEGLKLLRARKSEAF